METKSYLLKPFISEAYYMYFTNVKRLLTWSRDSSEMKLEFVVRSKLTKTFKIHHIITNLWKHYRYDCALYILTFMHGILELLTFMADVYFFHWFMRMFTCFCPRVLQMSVDVKRCIVQGENLLHNKHNSSV